MPVAARRVLVVVVGVVVLTGFFAVATRPRVVAGYERSEDGTVVQVELTCGSLAAGGGLEEVGEPTGVEVPQDEGLDREPGLKCPDEGPVWQAALLIAGVLLVSGVIWAWLAVGQRPDDGRGHPGASPR